MKTSAGAGHSEDSVEEDSSQDGSDHEQEAGPPQDVDAEHGREDRGENGDAHSNADEDEDHSEHAEKAVHELTEEEILQGEAATWLSKTIRGHAARKRALFTPVWAMYPSVVREMTWSYQAFFGSLDIESVKLNHGFEEQVVLLDLVLEGGLGALPHLHKKELVRPMAHRRTRASYLKGLVEFCIEMGAAYARWGRGGPAEFMWQSVETLCMLPPCVDTNASRTLDACKFKGKAGYLVRTLMPVEFL